MSYSPYKKPEAKDRPKRRIAFRVEDGKAPMMEFVLEDFFEVFGQGEVEKRERVHKAVDKMLDIVFGKGK